jgi:hypothetical protein
MKKPTVNFTHCTFQRAHLPDHLLPMYGKYVDNDQTIPYACVYVLDHPKLGRGTITTSIVVKQYKNGNFDTLNTKYKKVLDKD